MPLLGHARGLVGPVLAVLLRRGDEHARPDEPRRAKLARSHARATAFALCASLERATPLATIRSFTATGAGTERRTCAWSSLRSWLLHRRVGEAIIPAAKDT